MKYNKIIGLVKILCNNNISSRITSIFNIRAVIVMASYGVMVSPGYVDGTRVKVRGVIKQW